MTKRPRHAPRPSARPASAPAEVLPAVAISVAQAELILQHQQVAQQAQAMLTLVFTSVLAGHGVSAWAQAGLEGYPEAPTIRYRPTAEPGPAS